MAKIAGGSGEQKAVFIDTNLDTHLAILVSVNDTVFDIKRKIQSEHSKCFKKFGEIEIHALKVRRKKKDYCLSDLMPVGVVFGGVANKWFLSADVSSQDVCYDAVGYSTEFHRDHNLLMLPGPHLESPLKRHRRIDGGNLRADNLSSDSGSGNLQMLVIINNEDNLKSSSSDTYKRLNPKVDGVLNGSLEKDTIPVVDSKRTGKSSGLIAEVTSINSNKESLDIGTLGKNKVKKKKKVTANVSALGGANAVEVANALVGGLNHSKLGDESLEIDHLKHSSLDLRNKYVLEEDKRMDSQGEEDRVFKSQNEDMPVKRSNKTKLTGKKNSKRKTKDEVGDDAVSGDIDAPLSISAKSHNLPVEGSIIANVQKNTVNDQLIGNGNNDVHRSISLDGLVVSNPQTTEKLDSSSRNNLNMDEDKTEELGKFERALDAKDRERETKTVGTVPESRAKKSNKRKKNEDAPPNQTDAKGEVNVGVPDAGEMEEEIMRPNKRTKIWDDVLDVVKMVGIENEESGEPIARDNERKSKATGVALTSERTRAHKRKKSEFDNAACRSPLFGEPDKLRLDEHVVVHENIQMTQGDTDEKVQQIQVSNSGDNELKQQSGMVASAMKSAGRKQKAERGKNSRSEVKMRKSNNGTEDMKDREKPAESASLFSTSGLGDEPSTVDSTEREKLLKSKSKPKISVREEDNFSQSDTEPQKLIQNQKSKDDTDSGSKVAKKKTRQKQASALTNISVFHVNDQNRSIKHERSESSRPPKSEALQDDVDEYSSSHPEHAYKGNTVVTMEADIETKSKKGELDDEVHSYNHGSDNGPPQEANDMNVTDAESVKLTQVQKSDNGDGSRNKKSRKSKQKQSPAVKSISELPPKDENISMKFDMSDPTRARKAADMDDKMEPSSACQEQIDKSDSLISATADIEISKGAVQGEAPLKTHGGDVGAHIEANETRQNDADPMQLTQIQSEKNDDTKRKPKRKTKQNNTMKVERSKSTYSKSEAEKGEMESSSSPVRSIAKGQVDENINIPNHGRDVNTQQEAKDASHANAEPVMLTQAQASEGDTKPKKRTKQQLTSSEKNPPKDSQTAQDDTSNEHSLEKDPKDTRVKIPPNASKNTGREGTSARTELRESTDMGQQKRPIVLSGAKRSKADSLIKPNKNDDSESTSAESDSPVKSSHQGKAKKQLPKMEQRRSGVAISSSKSAGKVAQKPAVMRSLISKSSSIFKDASSSSSEDKDGGNSDSSTETPNNRSSSSDSSDGESRGSWMSPKRGNPKEDGGVNSLSQSIPNKLPMASIFRSSRKYKKAKVIASQLQLEDDESQPVDVVPDSQVDA